VWIKRQKADGRRQEFIFSIAGSIATTLENKTKKYISKGISKPRPF
jgi:hypothetical protein